MLDIKTIREREEDVRRALTARGVEVDLDAVVALDRERRTLLSEAEALKNLRARTGAEVVVFIGDDHSDESAMETLGPLDLGLKVGDAASYAAPNGKQIEVKILAVDTYAG